MKTRQAVLLEPGRFGFREVDLNPGPKQLLIKVAACGLCNWELTHWRGETGTCPQTLGHEWCGTVAALGEGVTKFKIGDHVVVQPGLGLAGFADYALNTEDLTFRLDDSVELRYAIAEPVKCTTTVVRAAAPEPGDYGMVVGTGPMSLWCIMALRRMGLRELIVAGRDEARLAVARKYGATRTVNLLAPDLTEQLCEITDGHFCDFIIEGTGRPGTLQKCFSWIRMTQGRICYMSSATKAEIDFHEAVERGCNIHFTHPSFSLDQAEDLRRAVLMINDGTYQIKDLITHEFKLADIQKAFEFYSRKPDGYLKGIITP